MKKDSSSIKNNSIGSQTIVIISFKCFFFFVIMISQNNTIERDWTFCTHSFFYRFNAQRKMLIVLTNYNKFCF